MPDIWVHGTLHRGISWEEAERLAEESGPDPLDPEDAARLAAKMTDQALTNNALAAAGLTVDDLIVEGETPVTLDDLEPREYDFEGALEDLRAREAREAG